MAYVFYRMWFGLLLAAALSAPDATALADTNDMQLIDELERTGLALFRDQMHPVTGLIPDAARTDGSGRGSVANVAASGFALAAFCVADERGWMDHTQLVARVRGMLRFLATQAPHEHGFLYHFLDMETGARAWESEASSIDTALMLCGALTARQHFDDPEIRRLATVLYERVDWPWMLDGRQTLCQGWTPEKAFTRYRWEGYAEHMAMYLLGIGSPTHPLPVASWSSWRREPVGTHAGYTFIECPPLFSHQYSQAFVDFRNQRDAFADYWLNSVFATRAQRAMCATLQYEFPKFSTNLWGLTASQAADGYKAWGGPPRTWFSNCFDGTLVPCAPGGSIPFAPQECLAALRTMRAQYGDTLWGKYGFADAFNPHTGWVAGDVLAIDTGITLLMAENFRSELIWRRFMRNPEIRLAMTRVGFQPYTPATHATSSVFTTTQQRFDAPRRARARRLPSPEAAWDWQKLDAASRESVFDGDGFVHMRFAFAWDATNLHFRAEVTDPDVRNEMEPAVIFKQDCVELFVNPSNTILRWLGPDDMQFGFAVTNKCQEWFGNRPLDSARATGTTNGYRVEAAVPWTLLKLQPRPGLSIGVSPALNSVSHLEEPAMLLNWRWKKRSDDTFELGTLTLE
ncbi:MAG: glucoamylase family protein [bacterium]